MQALNLIKAGYDLTVWNRSQGKAQTLTNAGAKVCPGANAYGTADVSGQASVTRSGSHSCAFAASAGHSVKAMQLSAYFISAAPKYSGAAAYIYRPYKYTIPYFLCIHCSTQHALYKAVELSVCDSETCSERCNDGDAQVASTPTEVGEQCDVIVGMLADPAAARAVASDVAKGLGPGRKLLVCQPCIHALPLTWQCRAVDHVRNMQDQQQLVTNSVPACSPRTR